MSPAAFIEFMDMDMDMAGGAIGHATAAERTERRGWPAAFQRTTAVTSARHLASTAVRRAEHDRHHVRTRRTYRLRQRHVLRPRTSGVMHLR